MSDRPSLPAALANLTEVKAPLATDGRSFCTLHGVQLALNCAECDKHFPEQVKARELGVPAGVNVGYTKDEVQALVNKAVAAALQERANFDAWKASEEGQAAAAAAKTSGVVPPDHGPSTGEVSA